METLPVDITSLPCEWPSEVKKRRWRTWLARLALLAGSVLLAIAVLEVGLRAVGAKPKTVTVLSSYFERSDTVGWIGRADAAAQFVSTCFDVFVSHDADGLRRCGLSTRLADDRQQPGEVVWCLGDSGTWGWGVNDGQTYVDHLNRLSGGRAVYRNLGVCGASSVQQRLLLEERLKSSPPPDRVVVLFCQNDLWENVDAEHQDPPRPYFEVNGGATKLCNYPVAGAGSWTARAWLKKNSLAYNYLHFGVAMTRKRLREVRQASAIAAEPSAASAEREAKEAIAELAEHPERTIALREAYRQIKQLCDERGVRFAVATERVWQRDFLTTLCRDISVPVADLTARFERHWATDGTRTDFSTDLHYNETGHRLLAEALHEQLNDLRVAEAGAEARRR